MSLEWRWDKEKKTTSCLVSEDGVEVEFHPHFSLGTAIATGNSVLTGGYQHYWEVKVTRNVYGTDVMVGVTTENLDFSDSRHNFASVIGQDAESWGFSYQGYKQHAGIKSKYAGNPYLLHNSDIRSDPVWAIGSLVGVHLDTFRGTLEFYLNRRPLGVAFQGLKNKQLYPIVSSTSARSGMKLICAQSFPNSLQFDCIKQLSHKYSPDGSLLPLCLPPGLSRVVQNNYWFFFSGRPLSGPQLFVADDNFQAFQATTSGSSSVVTRGMSRHAKQQNKRKITRQSLSDDDEEYFFGDVGNLGDREQELTKKSSREESSPQSSSKEEEEESPVPDILLKKTSTAESDISKKKKAAKPKQPKSSETGGKKFVLRSRVAK